MSGTITFTEHELPIDKELIDEPINIFSTVIIFLLSIALGLYLVYLDGKTVGNPTGIYLKIIRAKSSFSQFSDKYIQWFFDAPIFTEIICLLIIFVIGVVLTALCSTDTLFRKLPGGTILKRFFNYNFFEEQIHLRLIPALLTGIYFAVCTMITIFDEKSIFDLEHFDWLFRGYTNGQIVTQIFNILFFCTLAFILLDSFISAGFIGGIFHLIFILSANIVMMILATLLGSLASIILLLIVGLIIGYIIFKTVFLMFLFQK